MVCFFAVRVWRIYIYVRGTLTPVSAKNAMYTRSATTCVQCSNCPVCLCPNRPTVVICSQPPASTDTALAFDAAHAEWQKHYPVRYSRDEEPVATCDDPERRHWVCRMCYTGLCADDVCVCPACRAPLARKKPWLPYRLHKAFFWKNGYHALMFLMSTREHDANEYFEKHKVSMLFEVVHTLRYLRDLDFSYGDRLRCVCLLVARGADVNVIPGHEDSTLLHVAARVDPHGRVVRALLYGGAVVDAADDYGNTAIHFAVRMNHVACVLVLLKRGAMLRPDHESDTPLHVAMRYGHLRVVAAICQSVLVSCGEGGLQGLQAMQNAHGATATTCLHNSRMVLSMLFTSSSDTHAAKTTRQNNRRDTHRDSDSDTK